jgi:hypothetical protein
MSFRPYRVLLSALLVLSSIANMAQSRQQVPPTATQPPGPSPESIIRSHKLHEAPALKGSGPEALESVQRFVDWASASYTSESEDVYKAIAAARENREIAKAFCEEVSRSMTQDHSRTLVTLALLGEMKSPIGTECLAKFLHQPFPTHGTVIDGEIVEQTAMGMLQGKAIDGLAYLRSPEGDKEIFWAIREHPSRVVRAEAIDAYLWNHNDSAEARATLARYVRPEEKVFLDRVRRGSGEGAKEFNPKLETFLKEHPELLAPQPEKGATERKGTPTKANPKPPSLENK